MEMECSCFGCSGDPRGRDSFFLLDFFPKRMIFFISINCRLLFAVNFVMRKNRNCACNKSLRLWNVALFFVVGKKHINGIYFHN